MKNIGTNKIKKLEENFNYKQRCTSLDLEMVVEVVSILKQ